MFRAYLGPSSGGTTVCIQQLVLVLWLQSHQDNRQSSKNNNKYQFLYTYGCTSLMMGLYTPETCRGCRNILRISCGLRWVFFTRSQFLLGLAIVIACHGYQKRSYFTVNTKQLKFCSIIIAIYF